MTPRVTDLQQHAKLRQGIGRVKCQQWLAALAISGADVVAHGRGFEFDLLHAVFRRSAAHEAPPLDRYFFNSIVGAVGLPLAPVTDCSTGPVTERFARCRPSFSLGDVDQINGLIDALYEDAREASFQQFYVREKSGILM